MPEPTVQNIIRFSWAKTKEILFPFELKRWLKILLIVWLAGQAGGMGGNFNLPQRPKPTDRQAQTEKAQPETQSPEQAIQEPARTGESLDDTTGIPQETRPSPVAETGEDREKELPRLPPAVIVLLVLLAIAFFVLFAWLSARFSFIFLDLMVHRDVRIRDSFRMHKPLGNSYFLWSLGFLGVGVAIFLIVILVTALATALAKAFLILFIPLLILLILLVIGFVVIGVLVYDFVLPVMYRDGIRTMDALRKLISLKPKAGEIGLFILLLIGFGILAFILALVLTVVVGLATVIVGFLVGLLGSLIVGAIPFLKPILVFIGFLVLVVGILGAIVLLGLITLPIPVFFRAFTLSYLARLVPEYNLLDLPFSDSSPPPALS